MDDLRDEIEAAASALAACLERLAPGARRAITLSQVGQIVDLAMIDIDATEAERARQEAEAAAEADRQRQIAESEVADE